jgi:hypothetical protein
VTASLLRLCKALESTNAAVVKLAEAIPMLVVVGDDDPLARDLRDAVTLARLSDGLAQKVLNRVAPGGSGECPPPQGAEPGSGLPPGSPYLEQKTGKINI